MKDSHRVVETVFLVSELLIILFFFLFAEYSDTVHPTTTFMQSGITAVKD